MALKGLATFKSHIRDKAVSLRIDDQECQLAHTQLAAYRFDRGIIAEIRAQAREHGITLPDIFVHVNKDGNWALATGARPVPWPEGLSPEGEIMVRTVEEINITNWQATGSNVPILQYQFDLEIKWTDTDGNPHIHNGTYRYPNDISDMPLNVRRRYAEDMIIAQVRVTLGINEWDDYA